MDQECPSFRFAAPEQQTYSGGVEIQNIVTGQVLRICYSV